MTRSLIFFIFLLFSGIAFGQAPEAFNYQSVIRDASGMVIDNQTVSLEFTILHGSTTGTAVYSETHQPTTNNFGIVNLIIGNGASVDDFSAINWSSGPYFIQVAVDVTGGTNFQITGTSQLISVPYALHANTAGQAQIDNVDDADADPANEIQSLSLEGNTLTLSKNGGEVILPEGITVLGIVEEGNLLTFDGQNWIAQDIITGPTGGNQPFNNMQPYLTINYCITLQGIYPSRSFEPFIGQIAAFGFNFPPIGWATCDGQLLSVAQNTALYSLLGTYYGGDGQTTFALPDLRGRTPIHMGQGVGLSPRFIGETGGSETGTLLISNLPAHNHEIFIVD